MHPSRSISTNSIPRSCGVALISTSYTALRLGSRPLGKVRGAGGIRAPHPRCSTQSADPLRLRAPKPPGTPGLFHRIPKQQPRGGGHCHHATAAAIQVRRPNRSQRVQLRSTAYEDVAPTSFEGTVAKKEIDRARKVAERLGNRHDVSCQAAQLILQQQGSAAFDEAQVATLLMAEGVYLLAVLAEYPDVVPASSPKAARVIARRIGRRLRSPSMTTVANPRTPGPPRKPQPRQPRTTNQTMAINPYPLTSAPPYERREREPGPARSAKRRRLPVGQQVEYGVEVVDLEQPRDVRPADPQLARSAQRARDGRRRANREHRSVTTRRGQQRPIPEPERERPHRQLPGELPTQRAAASKPHR